MQTNYRQSLLLKKGEQLMKEIVRSVEYRLYLPKTNEYILETSDDRIWLKTTDKSKAYWDTDIPSMLQLMQQICDEKHLIPHVDMKLQCTVEMEVEYYID